MAGKSPQPSHEPPFQAPVTLMKQWKGEKVRDGRGKTLNEPLHCTPDDKLSDQRNVQSYHVPCEPALMGLTAGFPLSLWAASALSLQTA